jgi:hypothetical protein
MKKGEIFTFLKVFANINQAEIKIISNRKIDNLQDFIIKENELNSVKLKSIKGRTFGLINKSFNEKANNNLTQTLLTPIKKEEIKSIIESIN